MNFNIGTKLYYDKTSQDDILSMQNACIDNNWSLEDGTDDGGYYYIIRENIEPEIPLDEQKQYFINLVQNHLDAKCQMRGYDNGFACASYATSSVPKFREEAEAFVKWRDAVWTYCYQQLDLFVAGKREVPTDLIAELPTLEW